MLEWLTARLQPARAPRPRQSGPEPPPLSARRALAGPYALLYTYLDRRFADTVVLTFAQVEDVLGFALPAAARIHTEWWTDPSENVIAPHHSDSWTLARRTAQPNLSARIVSFARAC
jgi:hypothetical protein